MAEDKLENEVVEAIDVSTEEKLVEETAEEVNQVVEPTITKDSTVEEKVEEPKEKVNKQTSSKKSVSAIVSDTVEDEDIDTLLDKLIAEEKNSGNIIGSLDADKVVPVALDADAAKVAVFSSKNVSWGGYGSVYKGYNILSKRSAEAWLTRSHVRLASPAEVAQHLR
jgi:hypothetical protein